MVNKPERGVISLWKIKLATYVWGRQWWTTHGLQNFSNNSLLTNLIQHVCCDYRHGAGRVALLEGGDDPNEAEKRETWLERENWVDEDQKACTSVYTRPKMTETEWRRERRRTHVITKLFHLWNNKRYAGLSYSLSFFPLLHLFCSILPAECCQEAEERRFNVAPIS